MGQFALLFKVFGQAEEVTVATDDNRLVVVGHFFHGVQNQFGVDVAFDGWFFGFFGGIVFFILMGLLVFSLLVFGLGTLFGAVVIV